MKAFIVVVLIIAAVLGGLWLYGYNLADHDSGSLAGMMAGSRKSQSLNPISKAGYDARMKKAVKEADDYFSNGFRSGLGSEFDEGFKRGYRDARGL